MKNLFRVRLSLLKSNVVLHGKNKPTNPPTPTETVTETLTPVVNVVVASTGQVMSSPGIV